jgi:hypothetical protein
LQRWCDANDPSSVVRASVNTLADARSAETRGGDFLVAGSLFSRADVAGARSLIQESSNEFQTSDFDRGRCACKLHTCSLLGIGALPVEFEVDGPAPALAKTVLVGLPEHSAPPSHNRCPKFKLFLFPRRVDFNLPLCSPDLSIRFPQSAF